MRTLREVGASLEIDGDTLVAAIEEALLKVYHKAPGAIRDARIEIDQHTGRVTVMATEYLTRTITPSVSLTTPRRIPPYRSRHRSKRYCSAPA